MSTSSLSGCASQSQFDATKKKNTMQICTYVCTVCIIVAGVCLPEFFFFFCMQSSQLDRCFVCVFQVPRLGYFQGVFFATGSGVFLQYSHYSMDVLTYITKIVLYFRMYVCMYVCMYVLEKRLLNVKRKKGIQKTEGKRFETECQRVKL